jgi:asparagine synthetase B (glutamine-hydrolysing)
LIKELNEIIIANIREIPKGPLSLFLSGGIDSSLVLALLRKEYPDLHIHTFSLAVSETYPDIKFSRKASKLFHSDHHEIILNDYKIEEYNREYQKIKKYDFKGDLNGFILCSEAREYSKIIVTGDGGDECFGGYWLHKYPLGHKENGHKKSFQDISPNVQGYLKEMVRMGLRDCLFKEKSQEADYNGVWEYFINVLAPQHLEPLLHTAEALKIEVYTPLYSDSVKNFVRKLPYPERVGRKIEKELASIYLPKSIIERRSIGFDVTLEKNAYSRLRYLRKSDGKQKI